MNLLFPPFFLPAGSLVNTAAAESSTNAARLTAGQLGTFLSDQHVLNLTLPYTEILWCYHSYDVLDVAPLASFYPLSLAA